MDDQGWSSNQGQQSASICSKNRAEAGVDLTEAPLLLPTVTLHPEIAVLRATAVNSEGLGQSYQIQTPAS